MGQDEITCEFLPLERRVTVAAAIAAVAEQREPAILDTADTIPGRGRFTILACAPLRVRAWCAGDPDPFEGMRSELRRIARLRLNCNSRAETSQLPFHGGWIGYFAYEAGGWLERLPSTRVDDIGLPLVRFGLYDSALIHDAQTGAWTAVAADLRGVYPGARPPAERLAFWRELLDGAVEPELPPGRMAATPQENLSREDYLACVRRAKAYIAAGDIFQVNLARRLTLPAPEPVARTYLRLRTANPSAYGALLAWDAGESAVLSVSPELFVSLRGREVLTRPIKGTRPRSSDPVVDTARAAELLASAKDRAELAMIVDLERNDLGRVCSFGSVEVLGAAGAFELETHPTVHHLVASVRGRLREECDVIDLFRAAFPGGSITGAPKIRAMQIIDELEPTQRSVYTGSIGYFGLDGDACFNIAIRTLIQADGRIHLHAGGGIVADSDPDEEYAETQAKALGMCRALGCAPLDSAAAPAVPQENP